MATKTIKVEVPFQKLMNAIDQLSTDEKLVLKKRLERDKITTWQERFDRALKYLGKKNKKIAEKEVDADVKQAIAEVRSSAKY